MGDPLGMGWCAEDASGLQSTMEKLMAMVGALDDEEEEDGSDVALEDLLCERRIPIRIQSFFPSRGMAGMYGIEEILTVEKTPVSDDTVEVPAGFTKKSVAELWGIGD